MPAKKTNVGWLLALGAALFALSEMRPLFRANAAEPSKVGAAGFTQTAEAAATGAAESAVTAPDPCLEGARLVDDYARLYDIERHQRPFRHLIALVPDPEESGHSDYFDAVLEGIDDAAAAGSVDFWRLDDPASRHYVRDRIWLPWSSTDAKKRGDKCWERQPGVILYRPNQDVSTNPALVVLLVGETPTWGVRDQVLARALSSVDGVDTTADEEPQNLRRFYRVLGPTFSGSAPSLRAAIERHVAVRRQRFAQFQPQFRIASGTATGSDVKPLLEHALDAHAEEEARLAQVPRSARDDIQVSYASAVPTYEAMLQAMASFLKQVGGPSALLSESGTAYGDVSEMSEQQRLLHRRFPPNLTSLRKAYANLPETAANEPRKTRAPSDVSVAPAEARGELSDQTPIAHDLALAEVLRDLGARKVRNVGISATDARDVIFIADRVGRQLPDVRLFTVGYDIRYLHPEHASALNGLLVTHAAPPNLPLTSTVTQNPMTRHVSAAGRHLLANLRLEPRARVSLIGNGSIRQIAPDHDAGGKPIASARRERVQAPRSFWIVYGVSVLVLGGVIIMMIGPRVVRHLSRMQRFNPLSEAATRGSFLRQRGAFWSWFDRIDHEDLAADDTFATASLATVVASAPLMLGAALLRLDPRWQEIAVISAILLLLALVWTPALQKGAGATRSARVLGPLMSAAALLATSLGCAEPREATFWLLSGGSPLIGGLTGVAMLLVVAWCWRARLRSLDTLRFGAQDEERYAAIEPPLAVALGKNNDSALWELEVRFLRVLRSPFSPAPLIPVLVNGAFFSSLLVVNWFKPILSFEPGFRHFILVCFVAACVMPIVTCFARLLATSRALQRLLRAVASPDLVLALARLPRELSMRLESQLASGGRDAAELQHPVDQLERWAALEPARAAAAQQARSLFEEQRRYEAGVSFEHKDDSCPAELVSTLLYEAREVSVTRNRLQGAVLNAADDYRACLVAIFVSRYVRQLRLTIPPVLLGCVLGILMTSLYFVQPRHLIASVCFLWVSSIVISIIGIYLSLSRDSVISAIGGTEPGAVTLSWGLIARVAGVTVVPFASLVASQYPEFAFWITSIFGGLVRFVQ